MIEKGTEQFPNGTLGELLYSRSFTPSSRTESTSRVPTGALVDFDSATDTPKFAEIRTLLADRQYENAVNYRVSSWKELAISDKCRFFNGQGFHAQLETSLVGLIVRLCLEDFASTVSRLGLQ